MSPTLVEAGGRLFVVVTFELDVRECAQPIAQSFELCGRSNAGEDLLPDRSCNEDAALANA